MFAMTEREVIREEVRDQYESYCKLWAAVFEQAMIDIAGGEKAKEILAEVEVGKRELHLERKNHYVRSQQKAFEAIEWMNEEDNNTIGSFRSVCTILGLHPDSVKNMVLEKIGR